MTSPIHIRLHHFPRHPVSRVWYVILLLSIPLQGCSYRHVIGSTSSPRDYTEATDLLSGHKVEVRLSDGSTFYDAEFVKVGPDSVRFIQGARGRIAIPAERFCSASYPHRLNGFGLGVAIGGGLGAIIGLASGDDDSSTFFSFTAEDKAAFFGVALAVVGGGIGVITGIPTKVVRDSTC